jgi:hypothetical protein
MDTPARSLVERLRERAAIARGEKIGTALGDALHFDEAADEIERLTGDLERARAERSYAHATLRNALQWHEDHRVAIQKIGPGTIPTWVCDGWAVHAAITKGHAATVSPSADVAASLVQAAVSERAGVGAVIVPEGWKLVPVEPTGAMLHAGDEVMMGRYGCSFEVAPIYAAMLDASPLPPASTGQWKDIGSEGFEPTAEMIELGSKACRHVTFNALTMDECRDAVRAALIAAFSASPLPPAFETLPIFSHASPTPDTAVDGDRG